MVFFLFFFGFYYNSEGSHFWNAVWPFYILLFLLILEKLSQTWLENKFGCDEAEIKLFKEVESKQ